MSANPRVVSQEQLQKLVEHCRRDPGSLKFVDLGHALLALGRPRDAIEVGAQGLKAHPGNMQGRMMVSRAFVALHQWKQAQAELLKIVKTDKTYSDGFRLLGEVLMRRADYDRALPVLQHAQNLEPANPAILALLKRARAGQPLDAPDPIPTPRKPKPSRPKPALPSPRPGGLPLPSIDDEPTKVADDRAADLLDPDTDLVSARLSDRGDPTLQTDSIPEMSEMDEETAQVHAAPIVARLPLQSGDSALSPPPPRPPAPPSKARPAAPVSADGRAVVRPRIMPSERRVDAAKESLRQSAAMGEDYLNNLLAGGLLDVPNVRVPDSPDTPIAAPETWGRQGRRWFVFFFTLLVIGTAGATTWYIYAKNQRDADVAKYIDTAKQHLLAGTPADMETAVEQLVLAGKRDDQNIKVAATFVQVAAINSLLYAAAPGGAKGTLSKLKPRVKAGDFSGPEIAIADAALTLAGLQTAKRPRDDLALVTRSLKADLAVSDEPYARWLLGRCLLAAGDRVGALRAFERAVQLEGAPAIVTIDIADLKLDEGEIDQAIALYDKAIEAANKVQIEIAPGKYPDHPLAVLGKSLARAERGTDDDLREGLSDISVHLAQNDNALIDGYKHLVQTYLHYAQQEFAKLGKSLDRAAGMSSPRFLARVALARLLLGRLKDAAGARQRIKFFNVEGTKREVHPLVVILDAELSLTVGQPTKAAREIVKAKGVRAHRIKGIASFDMGDYKAALIAFDKALEISPDDLNLNAWQQATRAFVYKGKKRREAISELSKGSASASSKVPSHLLAVAQMNAGHLEDARYTLEKRALADISDEAPNPIAYRSHLEMARIELRKGNRKAAYERIQQSLEINGVYLQTLSLLGRMHLKDGRPAEAADALESVMLAKEPSVSTAALELAYAEALATRTDHKPAAAKADLENARAALRRAKDKGADPVELARVAQLVDPKMLVELGLEAPEGEGDTNGQKKKQKKKKRGRR